MAYDDMTWVRNDIYANAKRRDEKLAYERRQADRKIVDAKQRLHSVEYEIANQTNIDRKELDWKLARERERLLDGLDNLDENIRIELGRQNVRFREQLDAVRMDMGRVNVRVGQVDQRINELSDQFNDNINTILSRVEDQNERARAYSNQFQLLLSQISELHPDKLTPGEFELLNEGLAYVESDIKNGDPEAAIGVAQTHLPTAAELRTRLEVLNDEYSQLVVQIHERCDEILERIRELNKPEKNKGPLTFGTEQVEFDGRISFWSNGVLDEIIARFEQICLDVENNYEIEMDIEALRRALGDILLINRNLDECVSFAHAEFIEFIAVQSLVRRIHDSLTIDNSWNIINSGFIDDDERRSFTFTYSNGAGLIAAFVVMPNREIVRRNRNGTIEYGETQFRVEVFQEHHIEDSQLCNLTRNGILTHLTEDGISFGANGNEQTLTNCNSDEFVLATVSVGDKIKDGRVAAVKDRIGL